LYTPHAFGKIFVPNATFSQSGSLMVSNWSPQLNCWVCASRDTTP
jgi:hypothetical protein